MATDQSEKRGFKIRTTEHREYFVKAKSLRTAIDISNGRIFVLKMEK